MASKVAPDILCVLAESSKLGKVFQKLSQGEVDQILCKVESPASGEWPHLFLELSIYGSAKNMCELFMFLQVIARSKAGNGGCISQV
jgi:hypothetical protein